MRFRDIGPGMELWWNDPDDGICSCKVKVTGKNGDMICCENERGGYVEVLPCELEPLDGHEGRKHKPRTVSSK